MQCSEAVPDEDLTCAIVEFTLPTAPTRPGVSSILRMLIKSGPTLRRSLEFAEIGQGRPRRYRPAAHPIWESLRDLAASRIVTDQLGGHCLFRPTRDRYTNKTALIIDSNNWRRRVWYAALTAANFDGNRSLSALDPRRRAIRVKDLRAYAPSVVVDSGGSQYEAAALLRHATVATTNTSYARALDERSQDRARAKLRVDLNLFLAERIDLLWTAWTDANPDETVSASSNATGAAVDLVLKGNGFPSRRKEATRHARRRHRATGHGWPMSACDGCSKRSPRSCSTVPGPPRRRPRLASSSRPKFAWISPRGRTCPGYLGP